MTEFYHKVTTEDEGKELREIMREHFDFSSRLRNRIKREKLVMVDGVSTPGWKKPVVGAEIRITLPDETSGFEPQNIPLDIVYEDDDLMIINKQPGLIVHPTKGHPTGTVANALMYYMEQTGKPFKIRFVNRLDMDTSGLLVVAKNSYTQNDYTKQMKENTVEKRYVAVVKGIVESDEGTIDLPIGRPDPDHVRRGVMEYGAPSVTHYKVLDRYNGYSLVELLLETGRTHQIRVHMSHIGHPVLGDWLYEGLNPLLIDRQALHAAKLTFTHPMTKKRMTFEAPIPEDIKKAIADITTP
ncbi:MAG: RluA family pseudouridine synthase [Firmicutes bacterium]|nr:RluA family pseudouridine synthase [Bacillota bacterium]